MVRAPCRRLTRVLERERVRHGADDALGAGQVEHPHEPGQILDPVERRFGLAAPQELLSQGRAQQDRRLRSDRPHQAVEQSVEVLVAPSNGAAARARGIVRVVVLQVGDRVGEEHREVRVETTVLVKEEVSLKVLQDECVAPVRAGDQRRDHGARRSDDRGEAQPVPGHETEERGCLGHGARARCESYGSLVR